MGSEQTYAQKKEEEELEKKRRKAHEKEFEKGREFKAPEMKIETPKAEAKKEGEPKQAYEASLKTTVLEKDIVIDDRGTVSKKYEGKETLEVKKTDIYEEEKRREEKRMVEEEKYKEEEREKEKEIRKRITSKESAATVERMEQREREAGERKASDEEKIRIRIERENALRKSIEEHEKQAEERRKDIDRLRKLLVEKRKKVSSEVDAIQKILLGPFTKERKGMYLDRFIKSMDSFIKLLIKRSRRL
ncbi:MAG: hypothetical protein ACP5H8_01085 [Candidatus Micrarchaeia archaeon]